jgi:hypothetical protein
MLFGNIGCAAAFTACGAAFCWWMEKKMRKRSCEFGNFCCLLLKRVDWSPTYTLSMDVASIWKRLVCSACYKSHDTKIFSLGPDMY